jgi:hypothetical protein
MGALLRAVPTTSLGDAMSMVGTALEIGRNAREPSGAFAHPTTYSALMPAALITFDHFADSVRKNAVHSSGVLAIAS